MIDITERAKFYWENGNNCARSAACGILDYYDYPEISKYIRKALLPFGGGIGEGSVCGSATGALAALSIILSEKGFSDEEISQKTKMFKEKFRKEFSAIDCRDILDEFRLEDGSIDKENPKRREKCTKTVIRAVLIVKELVDPL